MGGASPPVRRESAPDRAPRGTRGSPAPSPHPLDRACRRVGSGGRPSLAPSTSGTVGVRDNRCHGTDRSRQAQLLPLNRSTAVLVRHGAKPTARTAAQNVAHVGSRAHKIQHRSPLPHRAAGQPTIGSRTESSGALAPLVTRRLSARLAAPLGVGRPEPLRFQGGMARGNSGDLRGPGSERNESALFGASFGCRLVLAPNAKSPADAGLFFPGPGVRLRNRSRAQPIRSAGHRRARGDRSLAWPD